MSRLIGYVANRADRVRHALYQERDVLGPGAASTDASGWGIGFYAGDEVLHKKRPTRAGELVDWQNLAGDVRSHCAVLHSRQPTVGDFRAENAHPFRMRSWLFAHNAHPFRMRSWLFAHEGSIGRFEMMRDNLAHSIPDFLRRNIRGQTDSEYVFHTVLALLHDAGQLDNPNTNEAPTLTAISAAVTLVERLSAEVGGPEPSLSFILTNGRTMYALRHGAPMAYVERLGLHDPPEDYKAPPTGSTQLRYAMIVSGVDDPPVGWEALPERSVAVVERNLDVTVHSL